MDIQDNVSTAYLLSIIKKSFKNTPTIVFIKSFSHFCDKFSGGKTVGQSFVIFLEWINLFRKRGGGEASASRARILFHARLRFKKMDFVTKVFKMVSREKKKLMLMQFKIKFYCRKSFSAHLIPIPIQTKLT